MARFVKGDVVVISFPFSDLSASKRRPAFVLAALPGDVILCQITSRTTNLSGAVLITAADFKDGGLHRDSSVRPDRLFTADSGIIAYRAGGLSDAKVREVVNAVVQLVTT